MPNAPVQRIDQVVHDEYAKALDIIQQGPEGALPILGLPLRFDGVRLPMKKPRRVSANMGATG